MAQHAQVVLSDGTKSVNVICYNNAVTAIPAKTAVLYETVAGYLRAVVKPTAAGGRARTAGVTKEAIAAGGYGMVTVFGPALAVAHEAIVTGQKVMVSDVNGHEGQVVLSSAAAATEELGFCLQAGAADGDTFEIFVNPSTLPKSA